MCLNSEKLQMRYVNGEYIGTGYKAYNGTHNYTINQWYEATGRYATFPLNILSMSKDSADYITKSVNNYGINRESTDGEDNDQNYICGFHIFLNIDDASHYYERNVVARIVKVEYKDVVGFGRQKISKYNGAERFSCETDCVISRYMRIVE